MNKDKMEFVIYILNKVANSVNKTTSEVYKSLSEKNYINNYLVEFYDVLHTQNSDVVADETIKYIEDNNLIEC